MAIITQTAAEHTSGYQAKDVMKDLLGRLDEEIGRASCRERV